MLKVKHKRTGKIITSNDAENPTVKGLGFEELIIGFNGKIYEVEGYSYDGAGGYTLEDKSNEYELVIE